MQMERERNSKRNTRIWDRVARLLDDGEKCAAIKNAFDEFSQSQRTGMGVIDACWDISQGDVPIFSGLIAAIDDVLLFDARKMELFVDGVGIFSQRYTED